MDSATRAHTSRPARVGRSEMLAAASWLTDRDEAICAGLYEHRVLTTHHLCDLYFADARRARRRLLRLYHARVVERFRPRRQRGSAPWHYLLDELGTRVVASTQGVEAASLRLRLERDAHLAQSPRLGHLVATNDFFVALCKACRTEERISVTRWWGEQRCARELRGGVRPDGLGRLEGDGKACTFALELDRGTERGDRLGRKLSSYRRLARRPGAPDAVAFLFPSALRERRARSQLDHDLPLVIATSHRRLASDAPLGPGWLRLGDDTRVPLLDLSGNGRP